MKMSRLQQSLRPRNEIMTNCDSYMSKLLKKNEKCRLVKPVIRTGATISSRMPSMKAVVPVKLEKPDRLETSSDSDLVHKEVINNKMAQVEVTVRTVSRSRSRSSSVTEKREPWGKILQIKSDIDDHVTNYDYGLGTIHFLSQELKQRLLTLCPGKFYV